MAQRRSQLTMSSVCRYMAANLIRISDVGVLVSFDCGRKLYPYTFPSIY